MVRDSMETSTKWISNTVSSLRYSAPSPLASLSFFLSSSRSRTPSFFWTVCSNSPSFFGRSTWFFLVLEAVGLSWFGALEKSRAPSASQIDYICRLSSFFLQVHTDSTECHLKVSGSFFALASNKSVNSSGQFHPSWPTVIWSSSRPTNDDEQRVEVSHFPGPGSSR